jgi:acetylornithine deacetylase/succinyl-diaminopimelate desuccinylase-like protein
MSSIIERVLNLACAIQQIPAPTFHEQKRAQAVYDTFTALGLSDVEVDEIGNVYARRPGNGAGRPVLVTAHTDTVFPASTPLTLQRTAERICGPGIGDNSLGVAGLSGLVWLLNGEALPGDLWLVADVGEEGLGDLRGMRRVIERFGRHVKAIIVLEGMALGHIYHAGIGVKRYSFTARADGGHSWLNFGRPSAIHTLVRLASALTELNVPTSPKTTFNIGTIEGGTSVNTIAREASLSLDLRSESPEALNAIDARVQAIFGGFNRNGTQLESRVTSNRPSGSLARDHALVQLAARALSDIGLSPTLEGGSTDANIPLSLGLPCVCIGLTHGANAHRPDEYIETAPLAQGLQALTATVRGALQL